MDVTWLIYVQIGFDKIGGYSGLRNRYMNAVPDEVLLGNTTCGISRPDSFILLRDPINSDMPWPGFIFGGQLTASVWYWCADQVHNILFIAKKKKKKSVNVTLGLFRT